MLLWRNVEKATCLPEKGGCGGVHAYHTRGCKPVAIPDGWAGTGLVEETDPIPEGWVEGRDFSTFPGLDYETA